MIGNAHVFRMLCKAKTKYSIIKGEIQNKSEKVDAVYLLCYHIFNILAPLFVFIATMEKNLTSSFSNICAHFLRQNFLHKCRTSSYAINL